MVLVTLHKQQQRDKTAFLLTGEWWEATLHYVAMTAAPAGAWLMLQKPISGWVERVPALGRRLAR